jgi:hypothetical protein
MTQLEDMLRTAFHEKAGRIPDEPPPLGLGPAPSPRAARGGGGRSRGMVRRRRLIPIAAAAAVLAMVAGTAITARVLSGPAANPAGRPVAGGAPRYYVALALDAKPRNTQNVTAVVRETQTGTVVARLAPPRPYITFGEVTGAANDRTFILEAQAAATAPDVLPAYRFFVLHVDPGAPSPASQARLTPLRLPTPDDTAPLTIVLSPDGLSLATLTMFKQFDMDSRLVVYNLATRARRIWADPTCEDMPCIGGGFGYTPDVLSWTSDGRELAVNTRGPGPPNTLRLLNVSARSGNLLADSRLVPLHGAPVVHGLSLLDDDWQMVQVAPDGNSVFVGVRYAGSHQMLLRFSVRTGALISVLNKLYITGKRFHGFEQVLWTNSNGSSLILTSSRPGATAGILHGRTYTPIPWSPLFQDAAW